MKNVFTQILVPKKSVGFLPWLGGVCLFLVTRFLVHVQERTVSGTVNDESGKPLPMVRVLVKSISVTNDADGKHFTGLII